MRVNGKPGLGPWKTAQALWGVSASSLAMKEGRCPVGLLSEQLLVCQRQRA